MFGISYTPEMRQNEDPRAGRNAESVAIPRGAIGVTSPFPDLEAAKNAQSDIRLSNRASNTNNIANVSQQTGGGGPNVVPVPFPVYRPQPPPRQTYPIVLPWTYPYATPQVAQAAATLAPLQTGSAETNALLSALIAQQQQQQPIVSLSSGLSTTTLLASVAIFLILGVGAYVVIKKVKGGK